MKKSIIIALTALAFVAWGCSSDHEDTESSGKFQSGTPTWTPPNYDDYEQTMTIEIQLQDKLQSSASEQDLLCAMINNEVRGLTEPKWVDGKWVFILTVGANSTGEPVSLSYYCSKRKAIYTIGWMQFDPTTPPTGSGVLYQPLFLQ